MNPLCVRCNAVESITHLLFQCPYAAKVWELAPVSTEIRAETFDTFHGGWEIVSETHSLPPVGLETGTLAASIVWNLWISRNQLVFQKREFTPEETLLKATSEAREWMMAQLPLKPLH